MTDGATPETADDVATMVAQRLAQLGRNPDLVTREAVAALGRASGGSPRSLQALLTSALFLASTESAPAVNADHVERAVAMRPEVSAADIDDADGMVADGTAAPSAMPPPASTVTTRERLAPPRSDPTAPGRIARPFLIVASAGAVLGLAMLLPLALKRPALPPVAVAPPQAAPPAATDRAQAATAAANAPQSPSLPLPPPPPPLPQPKVVAAHPAPPPVPVAPRVIIDFARNDRMSEALAYRVATTLRSAGIQVLGVEVGKPFQSPEVQYYFPSDRGAAERIGTLLANGAHTYLAPARWHESYLLLPGTVRVSLP